jgi:hypothetical protein
MTVCQCEGRGSTRGLRWIDTVEHFSHNDFNKCISGLDLLYNRSSMHTCATNKKRCKELPSLTQRRSMLSGETVRSLSLNPSQIIWSWCLV